MSRTSSRLLAALDASKEAHQKVQDCSSEKNLRAAREADAEVVRLQANEDSSHAKSSDEDSNDIQFQNGY